MGPLNSSNKNAQTLRGPHLLTGVWRHVTRGNVAFYTVGGGQASGTTALSVLPEQAHHVPGPSSDLIPAP